MFVQVIEGRVRDPEALRAHTDRWVKELAPGAAGWLGFTAGSADDGTAVAIVRFESEEAARANSDRPEQGEWWAATSGLYEGDVTFTDCPDVDTFGAGGSDDAGFVQVIKGKIDDPDALEAGIHQMEGLLHEARPEILGATIAIEDDGTFVETVAFTDEAAAREGEARAMPSHGELADAMRSFDQHTRELQYLDLHRPWFGSPG